MNAPRDRQIQLAAEATTTARIYPASGDLAHATLILAHGAGAGHHSTFMVDYARALSALGLDIVTFNFPYTEQKRRAPDRAPVLEACYRAVIEDTRSALKSGRTALFIGGKSMGGRMATHVAAADAALPIAGLVLLGYPLHPPGQPEKRRDAHLPDIRRPMLFVQGSRDTFGTPSELAPILERLTPAPTLHVVANGDHSFSLSKKDSEAQAALHDEVRHTIVEWIRNR
jgi:uncharacterized protein